MSLAERQGYPAGLRDVHRAQAACCARGIRRRAGAAGAPGGSRSGRGSSRLLLVALLVPAHARRMRPNRWVLGGVVARGGRRGGGRGGAPRRAAADPAGRRAARHLVVRRPRGRARSRSSSAVPQHPGLAPNGRSSMHDDGWATDAYAGPGPLGRDPEVDSSWFGLEECATLAFDSEGRLVALCGNRSGPVMHVLDPESMRPGRDLRPARPRGVGQAAVGGPLRRRLLLPRRRGPRGGRDHRPAGADHRQRRARRQVDEVDLGDVVPDDDCLVALLPDWEGNTWYVTQDGRVGVAGGDRRARRRSTSTARSPTRSPPTTPASTS